MYMERNIMKKMAIKKQIVVFGGCFNPPLNSHFSLAEQMIVEYPEIEKVIFVPVNSQYEKIDLIENEHRYQMLKAVCDKNEKFEVSRIEIDSERQLYTVETLHKLQEVYTNYEVAFLTGSDNLKTLDTWKKVEELITKFKLYILERDNDCMEKIIENNKLLRNHRESFIKAKDTIKSNLSSTFVREKIKAGKSIRYLTPDEVITYIKQHQLYR